MGEGHIKPRLVGGKGACSGRVEVVHGNTWATVCDAHFDLHAANVICNELQCGVAASVPGGAHFGEGQGQIWTERFQCVGNESLLFSCPRIPPENQTCSHANDASAICSRFKGVRLVNGSTECSGRVELQVLGDWGTLCDSGWDLADANVLCHQHDCGFAVSAPGGGYFGKGTGSVWKDTFHCNGNEPHLWRCPVTALGPSQCSHDNDASAVCSGRSEWLRLRNGESRCDGRVEISLGGAWSRVLDEQWDKNDASVVCRELQCGVAEKAYDPPKSELGTGPVGLRRVQCVGNEARLTLCNNSVSETAQAGIAEDVGVVCSGSGQIWLDDVKCFGNESELWECPSRGWGQHNCRHKEDAGVLCSEFTDLRLVSGSDCAGRLEVFYNGTWGSVCSNQMSTVTAVIVCKQLHCGDGGYIAGDSTYGEGSGPAWLDRVQCSEQHSSLWQCPSEPWNAESCDDRREETHITCTGVTPKTDSPNTQAPLRRLSSDSGRVTVLVVVCIILGALLCLVLILLGVQVRSARAQRRGDKRPLDPFSEAVYEEIDYNLMREKQMFSRSVSYSDESVRKLQYYTGDSEGENDPGSEQDGASLEGSQLDYDNAEEPAWDDAPQTPSGPDAPALPADAPGDGYDDAREVSIHDDDLVWGKNDEEGSEESSRNRDSQTGWSLHSLRSGDVSGMEKETPLLPPEDIGYDDVGHAQSLKSSHPCSKKTQKRKASYNVEKIYRY
ncbi:scavenger receptor cysteine-rich type 1 protein M130-like [Carettochelys insculpta]|uniref:scavenger receptor cysteine-rich type 1 protein M130-like n=1 Tax=Carettochelys insculpta TaxID=44489 RepID=UPI003EB9D3AA